MAVGKTLTIYLAADLKKFNSGLNQAESGLKGFGNSLTNVLGPAMIAAGVAAGALAVKLGVDGVKAAIEDEAAMSRLATTMGNLGLAHDTQKVEDYIYQLERSLGIADTDLRPAYDRLVRALGDTQKAQDALSLSLDVSAGSGKSLEQVTEALGKAYEGNIAGLSRLGAGIDANVIRSGNMETITKVLSDTFAGQATTSANTFEGQIKRLNTAADNMKEAFGAGLLSVFTNSAKTTDTLVKAMEGFEGTLKDVGTELGLLTIGFVKVIDNLTNLGTATDAATESTEKVTYAQTDWTDALGNSEDPLSALVLLVWEYVAGVGEAEVATNAATNAWADYRRAQQGQINVTPAVVESLNAITDASAAQALSADAAAKALLNWAIGTGQVPSAAQWGQRFDIKEMLDGIGKSYVTASTGTKTYTAAVKQSYPELDLLRDKLEMTSTKLENQTDVLMRAREAVQDYASGIQQNLLSGINLETAFTDQFDDAGQATGKTLLDGFNKQIAQAEYFGNVLGAIKAQGADQSLIEQIASLGPVTGAALAQQLIDDGLVQTMSDKWVGVQETTKGLAMSLVPEFLIAGQTSAEELVKGTSEKLLERSQAFSNMGKNIGKKVGAKFKAEFLADIAAAVKEVEAIQTAARAERVAAEAARQVAITDQQVGQALAKIIQRSDNRLGVQGVPVLA